MALYVLFEFIYVADYFIFEEHTLSTWDIITEHWGSCSYSETCGIPIMFLIQAWYLLDSQESSSTPFLILNVVLFAIGFYIFRISNLEKDQFKTDPNNKIWGKPAKVLTNGKSKLLVDGWWGRMRHPNYVGDILIAISMSLPCGFNYIGPYLYPIYLTTLLIHRQMRDDNKCSKKYGALWQEYCKVVPYKLLPGIY